MWLGIFARPTSVLPAMSGQSDAIGKNLWEIAISILRALQI